MGGGGGAPMLKGKLLVFFINKKVTIYTYDVVQTAAFEQPIASTKISCCYNAYIFVEIKAKI
jgi:hypothetical protein